MNNAKQIQSFPIGSNVQLLTSHGNLSGIVGRVFSHNGKTSTIILKNGFAYDVNSAYLAIAD